MVKRLIFLSCLTVVCGQAMAGWVKFSQNEHSVFYIDSDMSKKFGGHVMIWVLRDHASPRYAEFGSYRSSKDQIEVDCAGRRIRRIYSSDHPKPMGEGKLVHYEHGPMSWNGATPNTIVSRMVDVACRS